MIRAILTIDDIASKNTPAIVDYLKEKDIPVLMFAWGECVERYYDNAVYALQNGIIVGNHSYSHPHFSELSLSEGIREIDRCEAVLNRIYDMADTKRTYRPYRFPYGDKGQKNRDAFQSCLRERGFSKVNDASIPYAWWRENGLDRDIDTLWTYDFTEYRIRPGSGYTMDDVWKRLRNPNPGNGAALYMPEGRHILLLHAHDETDELVPGYYRLLLDDLLNHGVQFVKPDFV